MVPDVTAGMFVVSAACSSISSLVGRKLKFFDQQHHGLTFDHPTDISTKGELGDSTSRCSVSHFGEQHADAGQRGSDLVLTSEPCAATVF